MKKMFGVHKFKNVGITKDAPYGYDWKTGKMLKKPKSVTIMAFGKTKTIRYGKK